MESLNHAVMYFLSFKSYVVLPVIIFILAMIFRINFQTAVKSALRIGIGFIGIFMVFDYFVKLITPVVQALIERTGLHFNVLDVGWPPLAGISWGFKLVPVLLILFIGINIIMLVLKLTKAVDIDIWNYWHVILVSVMVYHLTSNVLLTVVVSSIAFILVLKLAEWSAPMVNKFSGMNGICIPHLAALTYLPLAVLGNKLIDKVPYLNKIDANPEKIQQKLGLLGEPMMLGLIMGAALGIGGGYDIKQIFDLAFCFAAVIFILPIMCGILGSALIPISEGMKNFITKNFPTLGETYIGLDVAVLFGSPSVIVTTLLLIPVSLILAFILPGINFIPLGDLSNIMVIVAFICIITKGNIIRSFLISVPIITGILYMSSNLAEFYTNMAASANYQITGYKGIFTSFLDGGNLFRGWILKLVSGNLIALLLIPIVIGLIYLTWRETAKRNNSKIKESSLNM